MTMSVVQISVINLIIGLIIFALGFIAYKKEPNPVILAVGTAFAFFGTSHIFPIYSIDNKICTTLFVIFRTIAYLTIIFTLQKALRKIIRPKISKNLFFKIFDITLKIIPIILAGLLSYLSTQIYTFFTLHIYPKILIYSLNATFCLTIVFLSFFLYKFAKKVGYLFLSLGFFFFMISHLAVIFNLEETFTIIIIIIRLLAYASTIATIYGLIDPKIIKLLANVAATTKFQVILILLTLISLFFLFYFRHMQFNSTDTNPKISPIIPSNTEEKIINVKVGLYIKNFPLFNVEQNDFTMNSVVWFEFNPHLISAEELQNFVFENGKILQKSTPKTKIIGDEILLAYDVIVNFKSNLNYQFFPIEDHIIHISIINPNLNPNEVILTTKNTYFSIKSEIFTADWKYKDIKTNYGISTKVPNKSIAEKILPFPVVVFGLKFIQAGSKNILIIIIPLFIAFFLGLASLLLNIHNTKGILTLSVASISSLIFDLFIIAGKTPKTTYFTISDSIFTSLFSITFFILIFNMFVIRMVNRKKITNTIIIIRNYLSSCIILFIILYIYYLLY